MKIYEVGYEKLSGENTLITAMNFDEALIKAEKVLRMLNKQLKDSKDDRYPDELAYIKLHGEVDL